jgi:hypothetical protein
LKFSFSFPPFLIWTCLGAVTGIVLYLAVAPSPPNGPPGIFGMMWELFGVFVLIFGWIPLKWFYCYAGCSLFPIQIARLVFINWAMLGFAMGVIRGFVNGRRSRRAEENAGEGGIEQ